MTEPVVPVGFDYAGAILDLRRRHTYEVIAEYCGFSDKMAVHRVTRGDVPDHPQGEAIWTLYIGTFGHRPPMALAQTAGIPEFVSPAIRQRALTST